MPCLVLVLIALAILCGLAFAEKVALAVVGVLALLIVVGIVCAVVYAVKNL